MVCVLGLHVLCLHVFTDYMIYKTITKNKRGERRGRPIGGTVPSLIINPAEIDGANLVSASVD